MTDHTWVLEHLASYNAGGLDAAERFRLEAHLASCPQCTRALESSQSFDRTMDDLFANSRPKPGMEDRAIRRLRLVPHPWSIRSPWVKFLAGAAALLFVGFVGAGMSTVVQGGLSFPGEARNASHGVLFGAAEQSAGSSVGWSSQPRPDSRTETALVTVDESASMGDREKELAQRAIHTRYKNLDQMNYEATRRASEVMNGKRADDGRLARETGGKEPNLNYDADRVKDVSVPGPVNPSESVGLVNSPADMPAPTVAPPPGFGSRQGQGGGMAGGGGFGYIQPSSAPSMPRPASPVADSFGGQNTGPGNIPGRSGATRDEGGAKKPAGKDGADVYYTYRDNSDPKAAPKAEPAKAMEELLKMKEGDSLDRNEGLLRKVADAEKSLKGAEAKGNAGRGEGKSSGKEDGQAKPKPEPQPAEAPKNGDKPPEPVKTPPAEEPPVTQRKVIRHGDIEFEIDSFESSVERITKIVGEERGFVGTVNSDKLPNGKVKGTIVLRVPPDNLDRLILKLRSLGDLKSQRIGSQDVTKMYTDIESRLRAARAMEGRLVEIIKKGTGEIKDLLMAEKELGVWRTKIEEFEGEIRYYNNLISLSTLNIHLVEREIRGAFAATETERVDMGIEVEEVEKAQQNAHIVINEAKGRIGKSELKQLPGGMSQAVIQFEVSPENAGPVRDRLKQMGVVTRLEVGRSQQIEGGVGQPPQANVKRYDVQFTVSLYNIAAVLPRETVHLTLVTPDTETAYQTILARVNKSQASRIISSPLDRQRGEQTSAALSFEIRIGDAEAVLTDMKALGEVMRLQMTETPDGANVTRSKRGFHVTLAALASIRPRETMVYHLAARDVPASYKAIQEAVTEAKGRMLDAQLNENDRQNVTAKVDFEVRRGEEAAVLKALTGSADVLTRNVVRAQETENVIDTKIRVQATLMNLANTRPREIVAMKIASADVPQTYRTLHEAIGKLNGWIINTRLNEADKRNITGDIAFEVRTSDEAAATKSLAALGDMLVRRADRTPDGADVVDSKVRLIVGLVSTANTIPRETVAIRLATRDVPKSFHALEEAVAKNKGWVINAQLNEQDRRNITGELIFEVRRSDEAAIAKALGLQGDVLNRRAIRAADGPDVVDTKVRLHLNLVNVDNIDPRETVTLGIEVNDVDKTVAGLAQLIAESKGRTVDSHVSHERDGRKTANLVYDVPLGTAEGLVAKFKTAGIVRTQQSARNQQVPDSELAVARLHVVLSNATPIVGNEEGLGNSMKTAFGYSFKGFAWSVAWIGSGLLFLAPWLLVGGFVWMGASMIRRKNRKPEEKSLELTEKNETPAAG